MNKDIILNILTSSKKQSNLLKPFSNELKSFINEIYLRNDLSLIESAYLYTLNKKEEIECSICNKKYKFIDIKEGYEDICSNECESKKMNFLKDKNSLFIFLNTIKEYSIQKQISLLKENYFLSTLFFYTKFLKEDVSISERIYCILNNINEKKICKFCESNYVNFKNNKLGYFDYCSNSCSFNATKNNRKISNLKKYGKENTFNIESSNKKRNAVVKTKEFKEKVIKSKIEKYGIEQKEIYQKISNTWKSKSSEELLDIENKRKLTKILNFGEHYQEEINKKTADSRKKNTIFKKIKLFSKINVIPLFDISEYDGVENKKYKWKCLKCSFEYNKSIDNGLFPLCPKCNSIKGISTGEKEVIEFLKELKIDYITSDRKIIYPLEIDILCDNIGIEYNGTYYHSYEYLNEYKNNSVFIKRKLKEFRLNSNIGKSYHLLKSKLCEESNIKLIHINEDEWKHPIKREIWKSILRNKFYKNIHKIYARDCYIKEINVEQKDEFLEINHLQGRDNSSIRYGLFLKKDYENLKKGDLVSLMTFGKARYKNTETFELYRFCNRINTSVIGSASKIFSFFLKNNNPESILSYGDKRFGMNNFYEKIGFEKVSETICGFKYIRNNISYNRENFKKFKLKEYFEKNKFNIKEYSEEYTGEEIMRLNGYRKVYDCGNNKYVYKIDK